MSNINDSKRESYAASGDTIAEQVAVLEGGGGGGGGTGTVTDITVVTANGISASITNSTTTPALTFTLGAITPTSVNGLTITTTTGTFTLTAAKVFSVSNTLTLAGTDGSTLNIGTGGTLGTGAYATIANYATIASLGTGAFATIGDYVLTSALSAYALLSGATFTGLVKITVSGTPLSLTNPTLQATNSVDNFTQVSIQNKSSGVNASADMIAYPDNNANDTTGFADIGITSSAYAQAAYAITTPNDGYFFTSAVSGAGKLGNMVICTDSTGSSNSIIFGVNGFTSLNKERARIDGATGTFSYGYASVANGINKFYNSSNSNTVTIQSGVTSGSYTLTLPTAAPAGNGYVLSSTTGGVLSWIAASGLSWGTSISSGSGTGVAMTTTDLAGDKPFLTMAHTASGTLVATTTTQASLAISRTHTNASSVTDNFIGMLFSRTNVMNQSGGTLLAQGALVQFQGTDTQTVGTLTPSYDLTKWVPSLRSTGSAINVSVPDNIDVVPTNAYVYLSISNTQLTSRYKTLMKIDCGTASTGNQMNTGLSINAQNGYGLRVNDTALQAISALVNRGINLGEGFNTNNSTVAYYTNFYLTNENNSQASKYNTGLYLLNNSAKVTSSDIGQGGGIEIQQAGVAGVAIRVYGQNNINTSTYGLVNYTLSNTQSGATVTQKIDLGTSAQGHTGLLVKMVNASTSARGVTLSPSTTGTGIGIEFLANGGDGFKAMSFANINTSTNANQYGIYFAYVGFASTSGKNGYGIYQNYVNAGDGNGYGLYQNVVSGSGGVGYGLYQSTIKEGTGVGIGYGWYVANIGTATNGQYAKYFSLNNAQSSATLQARTNDASEILFSRTGTHTTGTIADSFNLQYLKRTSIQNGAGGTFTSAGSVLKLENTATQTAGTLTDSVTPLLIVQSANSTGAPISVTQNAVVSTNFKKIANYAGVTLWVSNGTDPNGTLTGTAGDICYNGATNKPAYCTGTTVWVNFV